MFSNQSVAVRSGAYVYTKKLLKILIKKQLQNHSHIFSIEISVLHDCNAILSDYSVIVRVQLYLHKCF